MEPRFLIMLESLRVQYDKPMQIDSGFRCPKHNSELEDSSPTSKHLYGMACDIKCASSEMRFQLIKLALACGFWGIGVGKDFIHVDSRLDERKLWTYPI